MKPSTSNKLPIYCESCNPMTARDFEWRMIRSRVAGNIEPGRRKELSGEADAVTRRLLRDLRPLFEPVAGCGRPGCLDVVESEPAVAEERRVSSVPPPVPVAEAA